MESFNLDDLPVVALMCDVFFLRIRTDTEQNDRKCKF